MDETNVIVLCPTDITCAFLGQKQSMYFQSIFDRLTRGHVHIYVTVFEQSSSPIRIL